MKHRTRFFALICTLALLLMPAIYPLSVCALKPDDRSPIRVGYWPDYGISTDSSGNLYGYSYDYMREIAQINGWQLQFIPCSWPEGIELLRDGKIDLFGPLQKTPERETLFSYPDIPSGNEYGALYVRFDNEEIFYNDLESMNGKTLGTVENNFFTKQIQKYCAQNGISIKTKIVPDAEQLSRVFEDGEVDMCAFGSMLMPENSKVVLRFSVEPFYFCTAKRNRRILAELNHALETIQRENIYYDADLYNKYYAQTAIKNTAFTKEEKAFLQAAPPIRLAYLPNQEPLASFDKESKSCVGILPDMMNQVAAFSQLQFEYIPAKDMQDVLWKIQEGTIDGLLGMIQNEKITRTYPVITTIPLLETKLAFLLKKGRELEGQPIILAIPESWTEIRYQMEEYYDLHAIKVYQTLDQCLRAVLREEATTAVQNTLAADAILKSAQYQNLTIRNMPKGELSIVIGVANNASPRLRSVLNKSIAAIETGATNQAIYRHTIGIPYEPSLSERLGYNMPVIVTAIGLLFLILYIVSLYSRKKLNLLAYYDPLTGEMNLNRFRLETQNFLSVPGKDYAIMVLDIDKFKSVNDLYGYEFGDQMIVAVAKILHSLLLPGQILCHGNADKFYLFFEYLDRTHIDQLFDQFVTQLDRLAFEEILSCKVVISGGVCLIRPDDRNIISVIDRANIASKQVKSYHASSFAFYDQSMYDKINNIKAIENTMADALKNEEFVVYLQPKIELSSFRIVGAEALVRWNNPTRGLIPPNDFIPLFEENGFIVALDYYMLEQVCKLLERWKKEGRPLFTISVNLSRRHLQNANTVQILRGIVQKYDVSPNLIEIELTENAFDNCDVQAMNLLFQELHQCGYTVSVDDFGSGYSSLSLLKDLPIDVLKIDKSFFSVHQGCSDDKMILLLEGVISLSRKLKIKTISEGVETEEQVNLLLRLGCDLVQGFYFEKPIPIEKLEDLLAAPGNPADLFRVGLSFSN